MYHIASASWFTLAMDGEQKGNRVRETDIEFKQSKEEEDSSYQRKENSGNLSSLIPS